MESAPRKYYVKMAVRVLDLFFVHRAGCSGFVQKSYDRISDTYDETWTGHMRDLTADLIERLQVPEGGRCLDLTCGTGFATNLLAEKAGTKVTGVDLSEGMLEQGRRQYGSKCEFVQSDVLEYLKGQPSGAYDIVTCCWGLGYLRPFAVLRQMKRIVKPGGKVAIIDNSLFSLREIMYCSFLTFAEQPEKLVNLMRFGFLPGAWMLRLLFGLLGMKILHSDDGSRTYRVETGEQAIARLRATGAAAGFEYASAPEDEEAIFERFAQIVEEKYQSPEGIAVTHRYLAGIARR